MSGGPIVLVHGALQTAATWDLVVPQLERAGRRVVVAQLTGLEAGGADLTPAITLDTHIDDVVALLEREDLREVTLVGHSYSGMVITGVLDRVPARVSHLIYVDAFVPAHGQSALDLLTEPVRATFRANAQANGDGWRIPADEKYLDLWGLHAGPAREFVRERMRDFSLNCFAQPLRLANHAPAGLPRSYLACVSENFPAQAVFAPFLRHARAHGWRVRELPTGHDCQAEQPDAVSEFLLGDCRNAQD